MENGFMQILIIVVVGTVFLPLLERPSHTLRSATYSMLVRSVVLQEYLEYRIPD